MIRIASPLPCQQSIGTPTRLESPSTLFSTWTQRTREWLATAFVEDPSLRQYLLGRSTVYTSNQDDRKDVKTCRPCRVRLGHCGKICVMDSTALTFWRQLSLTPFGGAKDTSAYVLFDETRSTYRQVQSWKTRLDDSYMVSTLHPLPDAGS